MSKSTTVNKNEFNPLANGGCQSLLQSTRMGSPSLLMLDVTESTTDNKNRFTPFANGTGCQSLLQSTRMGSNPLVMVDVKVYYIQQEYIATCAESICIYKFKLCIPENYLIIWVSIYL